LATDDRSGQNVEVVTHEVVERAGEPVSDGCLLPRNKNV